MAPCTMLSGQHAQSRGPEALSKLNSCSCRLTELAWRWTRGQACGPWPCSTWLCCTCLLCYSVGADGLGLQ